MSATIDNISGGILTIRIGGLLTQAELAALQASSVESIRAHGQMRILVIAEDFQGWRKGDNWGNVAFMENDPYIKKMAIVGDKQWEDLTLIFTASPIRKFPIQYFQPSELAQAKAWLAAE